MSIPYYEFQVFVGGQWVSVKPSAKRTPYRYSDPETAWSMARMNYPEQCREERKGGGRIVRVVEVRVVEDDC